MDSFALSKIYWIALVMCPHRKIEWLHDDGFSAAQINTVCKMVVNRFNESYRQPTNDIDKQQPLKQRYESDNKSNDEWAPEDQPTQQSSETGPIENYLRTEPVAWEIIENSGGPLGYWTDQKSYMAHPELAKFAINYLSTPASSVDAERAFSCGRLMTNHLQHQMSSDTFRAKMALRLWYKTPLLPNNSNVASMFARHPTPSEINPKSSG
ncbi:hAT family dimerization protein [Ceratobasidium sp. AG-Ba]|nr:hAT family dimerization protein [Ceratobasidium sp. AG-Ba]